MNGYVAVNGYAGILYALETSYQFVTDRRFYTSTDHVYNTRVRNLRHTSDYVTGDFVYRTIYSTFSRQRIC